MPFTGVVDNKPAHHAGSVGEEARLVRKRGFTRGHVEVRFVQQGRDAEGYAETLAGELAFGNSVQLRIKSGEQRFGGRTIPFFGCKN